jgi:hypothetical protein
VRLTFELNRANAPTWLIAGLYLVGLALALSVAHPEWFTFL